MKRKLNAMSFDNLIELSDSVTAWISKKAQATRDELEAQLARIDGAGRSRRTTKAGRGSALKGRKVAPKFRNPKKRSETWAGRGAMPRWLRAEMKSGKKLEHFAIKRGRPQKAG